MQSNKFNHETYKASIIASCVLGVLVIVCGIVYCMKVRPMNMRLKILKELPYQKGAAIEMNERNNMVFESKSTRYELPKSKMDEFNALVKLGFERLEAVTALQK